MIQKQNMSNNSIYNNYINNEKKELYNNSNELIQNNSNIYTIFSIKPKFIKNLNEIIINCGQFIFNYLTIKEITLLRGIIRLFYETINDYYVFQFRGTPPSHHRINVHPP